MAATAVEPDSMYQHTRNERIMRSRQRRIALALGAAFAGVALMVILEATPSREPLSEDEFLEEVRQLEDGTAPLTGPGTLPPAGADESGRSRMEQGRICLPQSEAEESVLKTCRETACGEGPTWKEEILKICSGSRWSDAGRSKLRASAN